ncbi:MAG: PD-(D/E)XK nuclease family protein, partial [Enterococcus sp.]|nr:PD-(D/E)XK nuclease family protein [Enterococcus sp.]
KKIIDYDFDYTNDGYIDYLNNCLYLSKKYITDSTNYKLRNYVVDHAKVHSNLNSNLDYAFVELIYEIFPFDPFKSILDIDVEQGVYDLRPLHNLSLFTNILAKFQFLYNITVITPNKLEKDLDNLIIVYLRMLWNEGLGEFEDEREYVPSGCVSFMTIHQSKGMEFPIVVTDISNQFPRKDSQALLLLNIVSKYGNRKPYEPLEDIKYFDFWRLFYTAFSRGQDMLVLTTEGKPKNYFENIYKNLDRCNVSELMNSKQLTISEIKNNDIKELLSFTSHISVYETCSLQYKFYKEFDFAYVRSGSTIFGNLVHQTIEDMHKAALKGESKTINRENIEKWFDANYETISKSEHSYLGEQQKKSALKQVLKYMENQGDNWGIIKEAEVPVSLVKDNYIMVGKIDLIKGEGDTVELVDFKSTKKPDMYTEKKLIDNYRKQLRLYAHIVENNTDYKISKLKLYFTGEDSGIPTVDFKYNEEDVSKTVEEFGETANKILKKQYNNKSKDHITCSNCDFRYYCSN